MLDIIFASIFFSAPLSLIESNNVIGEWTTSFASDDADARGSLIIYRKDGTSTTILFTSMTCENEEFRIESNWRVEGEYLMNKVYTTDPISKYFIDMETKDKIISLNKSEMKLLSQRGKNLVRIKNSTCAVGKY